MMSTEKAISNGIVSIVDAATGRDLLTSPEPLLVQVADTTGAAIVRLTTSPLGGVAITASSDRAWLIPGQLPRELAAGTSFELPLVVNAEPSGEFAVLTISWSSNGDTLSEHVLIMRTITASLSAVPESSHSSKPASPSSSTSGLPDWMT